MTISILGQDYEFKESNPKEDIKLVGSDGYCDSCAKIICVDNDYNENDPVCVSDVDSYKKFIKRHEITHGFFEESGLDKYKNDELIVDWIAKQFPKMEKVFQQVGAL